ALDAAVADLVAARGALEQPRAARAAAQHLVGGEHGADRQQAEAGDRAAAGLDLVVDALAEQLVAAADAEDGPTPGGPRRQGVGDAGGPQALQVLDRRLRPRDDH